MRSSKVLYGLNPSDMPKGFKDGLEMQLKGAKKRLQQVMQQGYKDRDESLVLAINRAIAWNEEKLREIECVQTCSLFCRIITKAIDFFNKVFTTIKRFVFSKVL